VRQRVEAFYLQYQSDYRQISLAEFRVFANQKATLNQLHAKLGWPDSPHHALLHIPLPLATGTGHPVWESNSDTLSNSQSRKHLLQLLLPPLPQVIIIRALKFP